ncbi:hypothetical protein DRN74_03485 [Candidatus Micrarchaeota archaeon]|nr:MAG: hypothetical protein DRN74_03485 [Candidatus Micrarchaeota archaeon]
MAKDYSFTVKKGRKTLLVKLPSDVDVNTKEIIINTVKQTVDKKYQRKALERIEFLLSEIDVLIEHLKKEGIYDKHLEYIIREILGQNMMKGIELAKKYAGSPEDLLSIIESGNINFEPVLENIGLDKRKAARFIIHSMELGRLAYETGLAVSAFVNMDKLKRYLKKLEKESQLYFL